MDIMIWIGLGLIAGGSVSLLYDDSFSATIRNILFGLAGSIIGGGIVTSWDSGRLPTLEFYSYSMIFTVVVSLLTISFIRFLYRYHRDTYTPLSFDFRRQEELKKKIKIAAKKVSDQTMPATT